LEEWNGGIMGFGTMGYLEFFFKDPSKECIKRKNSLFEINIPIFHHSIIPIVTLPAPALQWQAGQIERTCCYGHM
jgi:hypothetical protein